MRFMRFLRFLSGTPFHSVAVLWGLRGRSTVPLWLRVSALPILFVVATTGAGYLFGFPQARLIGMACFPVWAVVMHLRPSSIGARKC